KVLLQSAIRISNEKIGRNGNDAKFILDYCELCDVGWFILGGGAGILAQSISKPSALTMTAPFASHSWTLILPFTSSNAM
ncbi:MAG: hypothetical protein OEV10_05150, partial [Gammaproteobacteria bacterium]|nr:hypothetical protein [Gammaproteobacteria bacterium]